MDKIRISEIFYSLQGEGIYTGTPSIFIRTHGCNFECKGFGQTGDNLIRPTETKEFDNAIFIAKSIEDLPIEEIGCDSSFSWSKKTKHLAEEMTTKEISKRILNLYDKVQSKVFSDIHLVITGGEPLIPKWQKFYSSLILEIMSQTRIKHVTFETNGTYALTNDLIDFFNGFAASMEITFSVSPKLSNSCEPMDLALRPNLVKTYTQVKRKRIYAKYVVRNQKNIQEVDTFNTHYAKEGVCFESVYLMPEGATFQQQKDIEKEIAQLCLDYGYRFSQRLHCVLFGNKHGT